MSRHWKKALKHKPLVLYFLKKNPRFLKQSFVMEFEDFVQVGLIGVSKASATFDKRKGSWSSWALRYIQNEIIDAFRKEGFHSVKIGEKAFRKVFYSGSEYDDYEMSRVRTAMNGRESIDECPYY